MDTVILTPFRASTPDRLRNWLWVQNWIRQNYDLPIFVGDSEGRFSPSKARNTAAAWAGDWQVAVFHDSDTFAHPDAVAQAVELAANSMQMVVAGDSHMYCDRTSTERILESGVPAFARPDSFDSHGIYEKPCSGVFAVNRDLWETTGGYVESLHGWGYEDLVFLQMCGIVGDGNTWVDGHITLHLWHQPSLRDQNTATNKQVWQTLTRFRRRRDINAARTYLAGLGHLLP